MAGKKGRDKVPCRKGRAQHPSAGAPREGLQVLTWLGRMVVWTVYRQVTDKPGFQHQLCDLLDVWPWSSPFISEPLFPPFSKGYKPSTLLIWREWVCDKSLVWWLASGMFFTNVSSLSTLGWESAERVREGMEKGRRDGY